MTELAAKPSAPLSGRSALLLRLLLLCVVLYTFFLGLELMGASFKLFGGGFAEALIAQTSNPFTGLLIGILATSVIQSSSTTTSMTVALVAGGALTVDNAIPLIMGANIGTSVTNTLVSLGHVTRREEFRRAFAGATVHDIFNWLTVAILFPLELLTGYLSHTAALCERLIGDLGAEKWLNPLKLIVGPAVDLVVVWLQSSATLVLVAGLLLLFLSLRYLVKLLRVLLSAQAEAMLHGTVFRSTAVALLSGLAVTVMVQSSSVSTSVMVPLVGAGVITLEQLFPFTVGANIGTTVTAIIAALATGSAAGITIALTHLLFNLTGATVIFGLPPLRRIPLAVARWLGDVGSRNRLLAGLYVLLFFFVLPVLLLLISGAFHRTATGG